MERKRGDPGVKTKDGCTPDQECGKRKKKKEKEGRLEEEDLITEADDE
jgi:hypothetical protein